MTTPTATPARENLGTCDAWACTDCIMIIANGENNPEWSQDETVAHHAAMDAAYGDATDITLGRTTDTCGHDLDIDSDADDHASECERQDFSRSICDTCGSTLGGERHAVTFWFVS